LDGFKKFFASADNQFGFKKGVGCNHAIYTVRKIVNKLVSNGYTANSTAQLAERRSLAGELTLSCARPAADE